MKKRIIYRLSPFNNETDMSGAEYIFKKLLAFVLIYGVSAVLGEGIIIGILSGMGYDPLNGVMPEGQMSELLIYYGFVIFSLVTLLYCRVIEKKKLREIGFSGNLIAYSAGAVLAVALLVVIMGVGCLTNSMSFLGVNTEVDGKSLFLWAVAFGIQGATEEIMCRGFLLHSLKEKVSVPMAIIISSAAFVALHLINTSLLDSHFVYAIVGIINLILISVIFSGLVLWRSNIWIACGLHSVWNFILSVVMGLTVSGNESISKGIILFRINNASLLNGADYGIEASLITTVVLGILAFLMMKRQKGRRGNYGI